MKPRHTEPRIENWLASPRREHQEMAEEALKRLGPQAVDVLLAIAKREAKRERRYRLIGFMALLLPSNMLFNVLKDSSIFLAMATALIVGVPLGLLFASLLLKPLKLKHIARALARYEDMRSVGLLTEGFMAAAGDEHTRVIILPVLLRLLRRMTPSDSVYLDASQRFQLNTLVTSRQRANEYPELLIAVIKAFESVGDKSALKAVHGVAKRAPKTEHEQWVQRAAQASLPLLEARLGREKAAAR